MFSSISNAEIDITELGTSQNKNDTPESDASSETNDVFLDEFSKLDLDISSDREVQPAKAVQFDDLINHVQDGITVIVCSPVEFMAKNTVAGSHLDVLQAGTSDKKVALVCVESEHPPLDFKKTLFEKLAVPEVETFHCYFGADETSKIFALRLNPNSNKCKFETQESHFSTSFFPYF